MNEDKLARQWRLLQAVASSAGQATVKSLAALTNMSDKTVRRDLETLRQVFPIVETLGEFGRKTYAFDPARVPRIELQYDESLAIFYCRQALLPLAGTYLWKSAENAFEKIRAGLSPKVLAYLNRMEGRLYHTHGGGDYLGKAEEIDTLYSALEDSVCVFITYNSSRSTEPVSYPVEPYGLVDHRGALYLVGYSQQHSEVRHWKVDRLDAVERTKVPFHRPPDFDLHKHLQNSFGVYQGRDMHRVRVRFAASAARYVREKQMHASQCVTDHKGGEVIAVWTVSSLVEIKSYVLSFGAAAEVLEPEELRKEIVAELSAAAQHYASVTALPPNAKSRTNKAKR